MCPLFYSLNKHLKFFLKLREIVLYYFAKYMFFSLISLVFSTKTQ